MKGIPVIGGDEGRNDKFRAGVRAAPLGVSTDVLVGVSTTVASAIELEGDARRDRTRSYIVFAAEDIRQVPGPVLDHDFIAGQLLALEVDGLDIVVEGFGRGVDRVLQAFGVEL